MAVTWRRIAFADELTPNNVGVYAGSGTFAGPAGATVTIGVELAGAVYSVQITPSGSIGDAEDIGAITVPEADRTATTFKVYNSGSATITFNWTLIDLN